MSHKINALTQPSLHHYVTPDQASKKHHQIIVRATKEVGCAVIVSITQDENGGWLVHSAVQYAFADTWYRKSTRLGLSFKDALHVAYGQARKLYHVTASRALAGLLHDSIVPATDDIDF